MNANQRVVIVFSLCAALAGVFAAGGGGVATAAVVQHAPRHMTVAEFARSQSTARPARHFAPRASLSPEAAFRYRQPFTHYFLLYVSAIAPSGAGFINVYPGWIPGAHPPLVEQITGLDNPTGLAVDAYGTLYVCQTDINAPVLVFAIGSVVPSLKLDTEGTLPVAVAVTSQGTVLVSTAAQNGHVPQILAYARGATKATTRYTNLASDAVGAVQTDKLGNIYFAGNFVGNGNYIGEIPLAAPPRQLLRFNSPVAAFALDRPGNLIAQSDKLRAYAHHTGALLKTLDRADVQALTFNSDNSALYAAAGTIDKYAYPGGTLADSITTLRDDNTFGVATFPAAPFAEPW